METEEIKSVIRELIVILLASRTREYGDGVVYHDHEMFDKIDCERLRELIEKLS